MLRKGSDGLFIEDIMDARETHIFILFLEHERRRHEKNIVKINQDIVKLKIQLKGGRASK